MSTFFSKMKNRPPTCIDELVMTERYVKQCICLDKECQEISCSQVLVTDQKCCAGYEREPENIDSDCLGNNCCFIYLMNF